MTSFSTQNGVGVLLNLEEDKQVAYMMALVHLSKVDGKVDDSEVAYLREVADFYGLPDYGLKEIFEVDHSNDVLENLSKIDDRNVALKLIKDMCFLSHTDDELSDEEVLFIGEAGQAMGIEIEKIEEISRWVIDRIIWLEEEKVIFEQV